MPLSVPSQRTVPAAEPAGLGGRFGLVWAGQSASLLGDQVTLIALPLLAVGYAGASTFDVGLLGMCLRLPFLVVGLPAGVWVTRSGLLRSMIAADIARGLAIGLLPALALAGMARLPLLIAAACVVGVGTVFFQVSYQSLVPEIVREGKWHAANIRLTMSESAALLCGPALGGAVVGWCAPPGALAVDAGTYAASVATLIAVARHFRRPRSAGEVVRDRGSLRAQVRDGLVYVRHTPVLNALMWTGAAYNLGSSMYDSMLVVFAVQVLHLSPARLGLAVALGGAGFPAGSALSGRINRRLGIGRSLIAAAVPSVAGLLVAALAAGRQSWWLLALGTLLVGLGQGCFSVNAITLRQFAADPEMRARATAVHRFVSWGALPVGSLAAGVVGQEFGVRVAIITAGVTATSCFWPLLRSPLAATRTPEDAPMTTSRRGTSS